MSEFNMIPSQLSLSDNLREVGSQATAPQLQQTSIYFDALPDNVIQIILSMLHNARSASLVCRKFCILSNFARTDQLVDKGICFLALDQAFGHFPIHPFCVEVLLSYGVNLSSITARSKDEIRIEFGLLLEGKFALLQNPQELQEHLSHLLEENSIKEAQEVWGTDFRIPEMVKGTEEKLSFRGKAIQDVLKAIQERQREACDDDIGAKVVKEEEDLKLLALPASEVLQAVPPMPPYLSLMFVPFVPSGLGSMYKFEKLTLWLSSFSSLPDSIGDLPLRTLNIWECPNLCHFPRTLQNLHTLDKINWKGRSDSMGFLEEIGHLQLTRLRILCRDAIIKHLPQSVQKMTSLTSLHVQPCSTSIFDDIESMHSLSRVVLRFQKEDRAEAQACASSRHLQHVEIERSDL